MLPDPKGRIRGVRLAQRWSSELGCTPTRIQEQTESRFPAQVRANGRIESLVAHPGRGSSVNVRSGSTFRSVRKFSLNGPSRRAEPKCWYLTHEAETPTFDPDPTRTIKLKILPALKPQALIMPHSEVGGVQSVSEQLLLSACSKSSKLVGSLAISTRCHGPPLRPLLSPSTGLDSLATRSKYA